jgi:hypothetical protein
MMSSVEVRSPREIAADLKGRPHAVSRLLLGGGTTQYRAEFAADFMGLVREFLNAPRELVADLDADEMPWNGADWVPLRRAVDHFDDFSDRYAAWRDCWDVVPADRFAYSAQRMIEIACEVAFMLRTSEGLGYWA